MVSLAVTTGTTHTWSARLATLIPRKYSSMPVGPVADQLMGAPTTPPGTCVCPLRPGKDTTYAELTPAASVDTYASHFPSGENVASEAGPFSFNTFDVSLTF